MEKITLEELETFYKLYNLMEKMKKLIENVARIDIEVK